MTVRKENGFEQSKMTLEESLEFLYWWSQDLDQVKIVQELGLSKHTGVRWDSFSTETFIVTLMENSKKLGGEETMV